MKAKKERRTGATLVESAVVLSLLFLCLFGLILGSFANAEPICKTNKATLTRK